MIRSYFPSEELVCFGSRSNGKSRAGSDLDIMVKGKRTLSHSLFQQLVDAFSESDLPFRVDLVDYWLLDAEFRDRVEQEGLKFT